MNKTNYSYEDKIVESKSELNSSLNVNDRMKNLNDKMWTTSWFPKQKNVTVDGKHLQFPKEHIANMKLEGQYDPIFMNEFVIKYLSYLHFLDSALPDNIISVERCVKNKYLKGLIYNHTFEEHVHSQSYPYLYEKLYKNSQQRIEAQTYYKDWKCLDEFTLFLKEFINEIEITPMKNLTEEKISINLYMSLLLNYLIENVLFQEGFAFFYHITTSFGLFPTVKQIIAEINKDELNHVHLTTIILDQINSVPRETLRYGGLCFAENDKNNVLKPDYFKKYKTRISLFLNEFIDRYMSFIEETSGKTFGNGISYLGINFNEEERKKEFSNLFTNTMRRLKIDESLYNNKNIGTSNGRTKLKQIISATLRGEIKSNYLQNIKQKILGNQGNFFQNHQIAYIETGKVTL